MFYSGGCRQYSGHFGEFGGGVSWEHWGENGGGRLGKAFKCVKDQLFSFGGIHFHFSVGKALNFNKFRLESIHFSLTFIIFLLMLFKDSLHNETHKENMCQFFIFGRTKALKGLRLQGGWLGLASCVPIGGLDVIVSCFDILDQALDHGGGGLNFKQSAPLPQ